jgi:hypothetical protein
MADDVKHAGEKLKIFSSYSRRDAPDFADELVAGLELRTRRTITATIMAAAGG